MFFIFILVYILRGGNHCSYLETRCIGPRAGEVPIQTKMPGDVLGRNKKECGHYPKHVRKRPWRVITVYKRGHREGQGEGSGRALFGPYGGEGV